jgi:succinate-semialdehyde dehydrogenase / glutarate-semialdehyde dehydrogenase
MLYSIEQSCSRTKSSGWVAGAVDMGAKSAGGYGRSMSIATPPRPALAPSTTGWGRIDPARLEALARRSATGATGREPLEVEMPYTGEVLGVVPRCTPDDVAAAVERARAAQAAWKSRSFAERKRILLGFHDLLLDRRDEILDLLQLESGKARRHALEEVLDVAITARYYANTAERHLRPRRRRGALPLLTATWEHHHPVGVVGIIAPWNYPLVLTIADAIPALAAGNGVVVKPDAMTPFSALWGTALLAEAGLPAGLITVLTGSGAQLGPHIIDHVDYVMFTGSTATGRTIARQAAERLIPSSMELGGKNAMIVCADADITKAVEGAQRAMFSNAGQLCISIERLMVHEQVSDEFTEHLVERTRNLKLNTSLDYSADMGSLVSADQLETVRAHVDDAVAKGATVLAGGKARPDIGPYFYEPTLLDGVGDEMTSFANETFGPVAAVSRFSSEDEAIERANDSEFGLNFSVWSKDTGRGHEIATRLEAGTVNVNEGYAAAWGSVDAPMGGMKASGIGRRHGAEGVQKYCESQTVAVQRLLPIAPPPGVSHDQWAKALTASMRVLRRLPGVK